MLVIQDVPMSGRILATQLSLDATTVVQIKCSKKWRRKKVNKKTNKIHLKLVSLIGLGLLVIGLQSNSYAASVLAFEQGLVETTVNDQFTLDIIASDFPSTFGGTILVNFDPSVVKVSNISLSSPWKGVTLTATDSYGAGQATMLVYAPSIDQLPEGDFVFATLMFTALGAGNTELALSTYDSLPLSSIGHDGLTAIDFTTMNTNVTVSAVPIPAAIWLLLSGIIGLFSISHKKRTAAKLVAA